MSSIDYANAPRRQKKSRPNTSSSFSASFAYLCFIGSAGFMAALVLGMVN